MKRNYHTLDNRGKVNERKLALFLRQNSQQILPMVELITDSRMAIDDLVNAMGRATIETVLQLSAEASGGSAPAGTKAGGGNLLAWEAGRQRVLERAEVESAQAASAKEGWRRPGRGGGAGLRGDARSNRDGIANSGDPPGRRIDAAIRGGDSEDGRHGGGFKIQRQSSSHPSLGRTTGQIAEPPFRRRGSVNHLRRWHALWRSVRDWSDRSR